MKNLIGSETALNLAQAFAEEAEAKQRYQFYAEIAKKEGYPTIAEIFLATADNERGHAEIFMDYLAKSVNNHHLDINTQVAVAQSETLANLRAAMRNERKIYSEEYPRMALEAEKEGFGEIAISFREIAKVEKWHHDRFAHLYKRLSSGMLFEMPQEMIWVCTNCGLHVRSLQAPTGCPGCHHPQEYFMAYYDMIYPVE